jgi:hypothetical protein
MRKCFCSHSFKKLVKLRMEDDFVVHGVQNIHFVIPSWQPLLMSPFLCSLASQRIPFVSVKFLPETTFRCYSQVGIISLCFPVILKCYLTYL